MPTLSVVMPVYNEENILEKSLKSVVNQSRQPDEFLVLDDGSSDRSPEIIEEFSRRHSFIKSLSHQDNKGLMEASETLNARASGDYIFGQAADSIVKPGFFKQALELAEQYPEAGVIFGEMEISHEHGKPTRIKQAPAWDQNTFASPEKYLREFLEKQVIGSRHTAATIFRQQCLQEVGYFRQELKSYTDCFAVEAIALKHGAAYIAQPVVQRQISTTGYARQLWAAPRERLEIMEKIYALMTGEFANIFPAEYAEKRYQAYRKKSIKIYSKLFKNQFNRFLYERLPAGFDSSSQLGRGLEAALRELCFGGRDILLWFIRKGLACYPLTRKG